MTSEAIDRPPVQLALRNLEQAFIDEYVRAQGYDLHRLADLPERVREAVLKEASIYSSMRLTEVESRSRFVHEIHEGGPSVVNTGLG